MIIRSKKKLNRNELNFILNTQINYFKNNYIFYLYKHIFFKNKYWIVKNEYKYLFAKKNKS